MQHDDQHKAAIAETICSTKQVTASVFSDKIKEMGTVKVTGGVITIRLDYLPGMVSQESARDFLADAISLSIKACFDAMPESFERQ